MEQAWLSNLAIKAMRICRLNKTAAGNHRQDMTGQVLDDLLTNGYNQVTWNSNGSHHGACRDLNKQVWDLQDFLNTTEYDAPLFSRSHPGDESCTLTVSGPGLPPVEVDSYGQTDEAVGTARPTRTPAPAPVQKQPVIRTIVPPKPKVEEKPVKPEQTIRHVPRDVYKEIQPEVQKEKDPFEKQDLSPEEYEKWLKELEREHVEESIPTEQPKKELTDEDWDEIRNFNVETSKKIPQWILGIFKG
ncbi:MAG: hypothetical protein ACREBR_04365 [bacterium]